MRKALKVSQESPQQFAALAAAVSPHWHESILRLANASERVADRLEILVGPGGGTVRDQARALLEELVNYLDLGDDSDIEPSLGWPNGCGRPVASSWAGLEDRERDDFEDEDSADNEPSLGSSGHYDGGSIIYLAHAISDGDEMVYDCEG